MVQKEVNTLKLVHSGEDYFLRLHNIIKNAKREIHIQTYIFDTDATGKQVINDLIEAAARHVKIYLLLDGYGSSSFSKKTIKQLAQHGIHVRFFSVNTFSMGRRLHHKIILADAKIALIGGINIADKYRGGLTKTPWLDYAVQIEGDKILQDLQNLCFNIYIKRKRIKKHKIKSATYSGENTIIKIIQNDWLQRKNEISKAYFKNIQSAKEEIIIVGSYFLPGTRLLKALKEASDRGVKIKIILSGVSDVPFVRNAARYLYSSLLRHHIELYEWNKSVMHGKVALVDHSWSTIGSFNLNYLSSYGSIEMNVEIQSLEFAKIVAVEMNNIIAQCEPMAIIGKKNGIFTKIAYWFAYRIVRISLIIVTYFPHKRFKKSEF